MIGECQRCGIGLGGTGRRGVCRPCSQTLDKMIARWSASDRPQTVGEYAQTIGLTRDQVSQRIHRLKQRGEVSH